MRPESDDFDGLDVIENLINKAMLNIDPPRICSGQVTDRFFERGRVLVGVFGRNSQKGFGVIPKSGARQFFSVFLGLPREDDPPIHHFNLSAHFSTGVSRPFRMDSRMPGIVKR